MATDKHADSLPWERQVKRFARNGLKVTAATLWGQCYALARWLGPLMPPRRAHQVLYHGILAPAASYREFVVRAGRAERHESPSRGP